MAAPKTADSFLPVTPGNLSMCEAFQRLLATNETIAALVGYMFGNDGIITDQYYEDAILPVLLLSEPIGVQTMWVPFAGVSGVDGDVWVPLVGGDKSRTTYARLFAVWDTAYGVGDGSTTFGILDAREKFPLIAGATHGVGSTGGNATVTPTLANFPPHSHFVPMEANGAPDEGGLWPQREAGREVPAYPATLETTEAGGTAGDAEPISILPPFYAMLLYVRANHKSPRGTIL